MKIEFSNPATRFLALSAIALTLSAAPSRADWTTVGPDGSIVTRSSSLKVGTGDTPSTPVVDGPDDYSSDFGDAPGQQQQQQQAPTYDGQNRARSPRVQANRDRTRQRNQDRRNGNNGAGSLQSFNGGRLGYAPNLQPAPYGAYNNGGTNGGYNVGYGGYGVPNYGYGYNVPSYSYNGPAYPYGVPYGYGYGYPGGVVAPGATIVLPQAPYTIPIGPQTSPNFPPPTFTSIPVGPVIITGPGYGRGRGGRGGYTSYPPAYPYGYGYPNGSVTQSYGGLSVSRGGVSASIGSSTTTTQSTWGTGLYR